MHSCKRGIHLKLEGIEEEMMAAINEEGVKSWNEMNVEEWVLLMGFTVNPLAHYLWPNSGGVVSVFVLHKIKY